MTGAVNLHPRPRCRKNVPGGHHELRGVTRDNLSQNPRGRGYRLIPALIGYQALQNLLPYALLVLGGDAFLAPLLNSRKPVLEAFIVAGEVRFYLSILPFVSPNRP